MRIATPNVAFLERLNDEDMAAVYRGSVGLIAASHEDFGLTPIEAAAYGKPSAALRWGGFLDTVVEHETGVFFDQADPEGIADGIDRLRARSWDPERLRRRAQDFGEAAFVSEIIAEIANQTSISDDHAKEEQP